MDAYWKALHLGESEELDHALEGCLDLLTWR